MKQRVVEMKSCITRVASVLPVCKELRDADFFARQLPQLMPHLSLLVKLSGFAAPASASSSSAAALSSSASSFFAGHAASPSPSPAAAAASAPEEMVEAMSSSAAPHSFRKSKTASQLRALTLCRLFIQSPELVCVFFSTTGFIVCSFFF